MKEALAHAPELHVVVHKQHRVLDSVAIVSLCRLKLGLDPLRHLSLVMLPRDRVEPESVLRVREELIERDALHAEVKAVAIMRQVDKALGQRRLPSARQATDQPQVQRHAAVHSIYYRLVII